MFFLTMFPVLPPQPEQFVHHPVEVCREVTREAAPYLVPSSTRMSLKQEVTRVAPAQASHGVFTPTLPTGS